MWIRIRQNNKVVDTNKYVLDVLVGRIKSSYKVGSENITEAVFSFFFVSKFEEDDVSKIDFKKLDIYRNDQAFRQSNFIYSNIDLIEFEVWVEKLNAIIILFW
jgi:hypothetical protein